MNKNKYVQRVLEHLVGPTGSVILHIVIVIVLVKFMIFEVKQKPAEIEVVIMEPDATELEEFEKELEMLEDIPQTEEPLEPPEVTLETEAPPDVDNMAPSEDVDVDFAALDVMNDVQSPLVMRGLFKGRSAGGRKAMLNQYAGKWGKHTEAAVLRALDWLKEHQGNDGSWGPNKVAMTGLGLLTFLAHGETTSSEKYGPTVEKAIKFLVSRQDESGRFCKTGNQPGVYAHAIAAYGISEAYGLTRIPALKPVMEKAARVILDAQQSKGGWNYKYDRGPRRDTSVGGWQIQALKAAYLAGADESDRIRTAMDKAIEDIKSVHNAETGKFGYTDKSWGSDSVNGIGILCMQLLGHGKDKEVRQALQALKAATCDWGKPEAYAMYGWYYITQAKFHHGGSTWAAWNSRFARVLTRSQNDDGSWTAPGEAAGLDHGKETNYGPAYATTFAALTLQVYYRFLPTYQPIAVEPVDETDEDDVVIEII